MTFKKREMGRKPHTWARYSATTPEGTAAMDAEVRGIDTPPPRFEAVAERYRALCEDVFAHHNMPKPWPPRQEPSEHVDPRGDVALALMLWRTLAWTTVKLEQGQAERAALGATQCGALSVMVEQNLETQRRQSSRGKGDRRKRWGIEVADFLRSNLPSQTHEQRWEAISDDEGLDVEVDDVRWEIHRSGDRLIAEPTKQNTDGARVPAGAAQSLSKSQFIKKYLPVPRKTA